MAKGGGPSNVSTDEILLHMYQRTPPALPQGAIAEAVGMSPTGVGIRLGNVRDDRGLVNDYSYAGGHLWWLTDAGQDYVEELDQ